MGDKSILRQEDAFLLERVRYIHLNPLRAKLVDDISALGKYPYCGHTVVWESVTTSGKIFRRSAAIR